MRKMILASTSPRRKEILKKLQIPFTAEASSYEENLNLKMSPRKLAMHLAMGKAKTVAKRHKDAVIIGADTVVVLRDEVLGKPENTLQAIEMLNKMSGNVHTVITGLAIINTKIKKIRSKYSETMVYFRKLGDGEISAYVKTGEWRGKAGGYAIQGFGALFIKKIEGDYYNVVGLPLCVLSEELKKFNPK